MKKLFAACIGSALAGMVLTELWHSSQIAHPLIAQEPRAAATTARTPSRLPTPVTSPLAEGAYTAEEQVNISVYERVNRSVVNISTKTVRSDAFLFLEVETPAEGAGSGSVLDQKGHVLTNYHVIEGAREVHVTLFDGHEYDGKLVGKDASNDVAVLKIDAPPDSLYPVPLGDSTNLRVGQKVLAIGNPFGLERTLSTGIISSLNRTLPARNQRTIKSVIQIDAAINPGNSGGPLLDGHGRLIGMNTAIASPTGQSAGVGFAIPVANISRVVPQLIERGKVIRPEAGITHVHPTERGLVIAALVPGGPAEKAGLHGFKIVKNRRKQGPFSYETTSVDRSGADLIIAVDGEKIITPGDFLSAIEARRPGDEVILTIVRGGREMNVPVRLSAGES